MVLLAFSVCFQAIISQNIIGGTDKSSITPNHKLAIGVRGGVNYSQWSLNWTKQALINDLAFASKVGWRAGVSLDLKLWRNLFFESGLYYSVKTTRFDYGEIWATDGKDTKGPYYPYYIFHPGYLEMPLMLSAQFRISDMLLLQIGAGTYIAYGINGKGKYNDGGAGDEGFMSEDFNVDNLFRSTTTWKMHYDETTQTTVEHEVKKPSSFRALDYGFCFNAGMSIKRIHLDVCYDLGLRAINQGAVFPDPMFKIKTRSFSINLGYDFYVE